MLKQNTYSTQNKTRVKAKQMFDTKQNKCLNNTHVKAKHMISCDKNSSKLKTIKTYVEHIGCSTNRLFI